MNINELIEAMKNCEQTKGMSILDHGNMVAEYSNDLVNHLYYENPLMYEWKLPEWLALNIDLIADNLYEDKDLEVYQVFHDCGKPFCRIIDNESRVHFPNHAKISGEIFRQVFSNKDYIAKLIEMDMDVHLLKSQEVEEFSKRPEAISLLITALAEIHANASMFGGIDSVSFKIKWKQINKRGKQILEQIKNKNKN